MIEVKIKKEKRSFFRHFLKMMFLILSGARNIIVLFNDVVFSSSVYIPTRFRVEGLLESLTSKRASDSILNLVIISHSFPVLGNFS